MSVYHKPLKKKKSGGSRKKHRKKQEAHTGRFPTETEIDENSERRKTIRTRGGGHKIRLKRAKWVNILDKETRDCEKVEITGFVRNPANRHFDRRHVVTKGTILETAKGKVRVTSRPGQDGTLNAVLIKEEA